MVGGGVRMVNTICGAFDNILGEKGDLYRRYNVQGVIGTQWTADRYQGTHSTKEKKKRNVHPSQQKRSVFSG